MAGDTEADILALKGEQVIAVDLNVVISVQAARLSTLAVASSLIETSSLPSGEN